MTAEMSAEQRAAVRLRLEHIAARHDGCLRPEDVVEDARDAASPLHACFTWDITKAAQAYWLDQARTLIRSVRVEVTTETKTVNVVAFVRDPRAPHAEQGYVAVSALQTDKDLARTALVGEFTRVGDMLRRARELAAALDAQKDVDDLLERVVGLRRRFMEPPAVKQ